MTTLRNGLASAAVGIAAWWLIVIATGLPPFILPSPDRVATALWTHRAAIAENATVTAFEVVAGLVLGAMLGALTAINLALFPTARTLVRPILVFFQAVPVFALAPILTLWLGYGIWSKLAMALLIIFFPVTSAFYDGLTRTPQGFLDLAHVMQASHWRVMARIRIPNALPALASGLRLAAVYAPIGAVIGEWVGASRGLGYLMLLANGRAQTDVMFAALLVLATLTVLLHYTVDTASRRLAAYFDPAQG
jgi:putative hydroxymethylpyrimidine transport system permease protein